MAEKTQEDPEAALVDFGRARTGGSMLETAVRLLRDEIGTAAAADKLETALRVLRLESRSDG